MDAIQLLLHSPEPKNAIMDAYSERMAGKASQLDDSPAKHRNLFQLLSNSVSSVSAALRAEDYEPFASLGTCFCFMATAHMLQPDWISNAFLNSACRAHCASGKDPPAGKVYACRRRRCRSHLRGDVRCSGYGGCLHRKEGTFRQPEQVAPLDGVRGCHLRSLSSLSPA